jgi:hypothetical protein
VTQPANLNVPCETRVKLQADLDALKMAVRKANDILAMAAESPDTLRRRRNSMDRWNEIYAIAFQRLHAHTEEHGCTSHDAAVGY